MSGPGRRKVSELGESGLLALIAQRLGGAQESEVWGGDDAAALNARGARLLLTTDTLVEGFDFYLAYASGYDVAWKSLAANVSDIAAMCGRPAHAVTSVSLPRDTDMDFFDGLLEGLIAGAEQWGVDLVGGDISEAERISVTIALTGVPVGAAEVLRSGARPGDSIYVTGSLGGAAGGLALLRGGTVPSSEAAARLVARQLRPEPRVAEAEYLAAFAPTAMIDISDGLAIDLSRLLAASAVGCDLDAAAVPVDPDLAAAEDLDAFTAAMTGGEDFELLFTLGEDLVRDIGPESPGGVPITMIGRVTDGAQMVGGEPLSAWKEKAWDHLK